MIEINWTEFKSRCGFFFTYIEEETVYQIHSTDSHTEYHCHVYKTDPRNNDQIDFEDNYKTSTRDSLDETAVKTLRDDVNSQIFYFGETKDFSALSTDATWRIYRQTRTGSETKVEWANNGKFVSAWNIRTTYFPVPALINSYSTNFDGVNDHVSFGDEFLFDRSNQFSFSFWIKPDNIAAQRCFYSKVTADANVYGISFQIDTSGRIWTQWRNVSSSINWAGTTLTVTAGAWNHVVITYTGNSNQNGIRAYINNVVEATPSSVSLSGSWLSSQTAMIGARNGGFYWSGLIDEVSIWDKSLSAAEVNEIYNAGSPSDLTSHSAYANLVHFYRMGDNDIFPIIYDNRGSVNGTCQNMQSDDFVADVP